MKNLILQPRGIGDVIFAMNLIKNICKGGIIWPVDLHFIEGCKRAYPNIEWVDVNLHYQFLQATLADTVMDNMRIIPIRHANTILKVPYKECMSAKYTLYSLDWQTWRDTTFMRDSEREQKLFELLNITGEYRLINKRFRSDESGLANIPNSDTLQNIVMANYKGFSIFDWALVIEHATEIHTVGTGLSYLIELLDLTADEVHCYKRLPDEDHFHNYDYILQKHKYIFH